MAKLDPRNCAYNLTLSNGKTVMIIATRKDKTKLFSQYYNRQHEFETEDARQAKAIAERMWRAIGVSIIEQIITPGKDSVQWRDIEAYPGVTVTLEKMHWYVDDDPMSMDSSYTEWHLKLNMTPGEIDASVNNIYDEVGYYSDQWRDFLLLPLVDMGLAFPEVNSKPWSPTGDMFVSLDIRLDDESDEIVVVNNWQRDV